MYVCICMYIYTYVQCCWCIYIYICMYLYVCIYIHMYIYMCIYVYVYTCMYTYVQCMYVYVCIYIHVYIYVYIYICINIQTSINPHQKIKLHSKCNRLYKSIYIYTHTNFNQSPPHLLVDSVSNLQTRTNIRVIFTHSI